MDTKVLLQWVGIVLGLLYLYLEYKANIWLWAVSIIMPLVHGYLYFTKGIYADCAMQIYYILAAVYGWVIWRYKPKTSDKHTDDICHTPYRIIPRLIIAYIALHAILYALLVNFTDSNVPALDSFTTALCMIATWMLSRKFVEQWLVWLVVDAVTVGLYLYKGLPYTASLYALYCILAVVGYCRWKRLIKPAN